MISCHPSLRIFLCCALLFSGGLGAADLSGAYDWKPLKIGGGGWVTGMEVRADGAGPVFARTDVAGAYRWEPSTSSWKQIVTSESMPAEAVAYGCHGGVDSLVAAPGDPEVAYMAFRGQIYRSANRGDTWAATNFASQHVGMEPNGEGRLDGERLAVDPATAGWFSLARPREGSGARAMRGGVAAGEGDSHGDRAAWSQYHRL